MSLPPSAPLLSRNLRRYATTLTWLTFATIVVACSVLAYALSTADSGSATREVLFNVGHWLRWPLYLSTAVLFVIIALGPLRRARLWRIGRKDEKRWDRVWERAKVFAFYGIGQGRMPNDMYAAVMHLCIFWGWVVLFIGTLIIAVHADFVYFLQGRVYLAYSSILDLFGIVALIGLTMALLRRFVLKPPRLRLASLWDDDVLLWLMLAIIVTGFLVEAMRIGGSELTSGTIHAHGAGFLDDLGIAHNDTSIVANPDWAPWSPVGYGLAELFGALGVSASAMLDVHKVLWWSHMPLATLWVAWVGYGKLSHIITGSANVFMRSLAPPEGIIAGSTLAPIKEFETAESFGSGYLHEFSWKQLMDADVCVRCGRCEANCPATISGKELTPMGFLKDIREYLHEVGPEKLEAGTGGTIENERLIAGDVVSVNTIWDCVTCGACETQCPIVIEHIGSLQGMRRYRVLTEGDMPPTAQAVLSQLEQRGHPWRGTTLTRTTWMEGLEVPEFTGEQEYLYWVGCSGALVERNVPITRAVARLLTEAGVSFGCLGEAETCNGDPARRLGNEYLAQMQMQATLEGLKGKSVQKIITNCPHCFNILRNEYPQFGGEFEVYHHTQVLADLVEAGKLVPKQELPQQVTYHDSCYLGRHNGEYAAPRKLIEALPGVSFVEMPRNSRTSFCCGAGGGHMFVEETKGRRINHLRAEEAQDTGAAIVGTNCPFCIQMFDDGVAAVQPDEDKRLKPMDLAELLELTVLPSPRTPPEA
ncbi:MAG TPA: heterodisulfide reductase-related iron-sulfur binding cluster [Dehalococcoidia bacterium]|nr:heterodisulfide reductase-related iron-sulfur binding cluster [Dehalococcoidia bacterium]